MYDECIEDLPQWESLDDWMIQLESDKPEDLQKAEFLNEVSALQFVSADVQNEAINVASQLIWSQQPEAFLEGALFMSEVEGGFSRLFGRELYGYGPQDTEKIIWNSLLSHYCQIGGTCGPRSPISMANCLGNENACGLSLEAIMQDIHLSPSMWEASRRFIAEQLQ